MALDFATVREALSGPGTDTRVWCSMGNVGFNDGEPVIFDTDQGCPMVKVILHPSFVKVYCRVMSGAAGAAGNGEGEWAPFVEGDEVMVLLPNGSEKDGAAIIGRFNNAIDKFPMESVAGQDPTTNSFGFSRRRTPFIQEFAGPIMWRHAPSGAFINVADDGTITLRDGENSVFQMGPDAIGIQGPSTSSTTPEFIMQLDLTGRHFVLQIGDAIVSLSASDATPEQNTISVPGALTLGTLGNPPLEHAISTEAVANLVFNWFTTLAAAFALIGGVPQTGTTIAAAITAWLAAGMPAGISAAAVTPLPATVLAPIVAAFAATVQKPNTPPGQLAPGIGSPGFLLG